MDGAVDGAGWLGLTQTGGRGQGGGGCVCASQNRESDEFKMEPARNGKFSLGKCYMVAGMGSFVDVRYAKGKEYFQHFFGYCYVITIQAS